MTFNLSWLRRLFKPSAAAQTDYSNIICARVVQADKHPNADRLRVVTVDIGSQTIAPVVCGAFNFGPGDFVVLALPGAKIAQNIHSQTHEPFILQKAKIRGIESQGMICAGFELGLSQTPEPGILLLGKNVKPGSQFSPEMIK